MEKSKGIERLTQQKLSEFRAKISVLEGENKVLKETLDKNRDQIKQLNEKLMKSEVSAIAKLLKQQFTVFRHQMLGSDFNYLTPTKKIPSFPRPQQM